MRLALATLAALLLAPCAAGAAPVTSVALFNDPAAAPTGQAPLVFHPGNARITANANGRANVGVDVDLGRDRRYDVVFYAPSGRDLAPGTYGDALFVQGPQAGRPGMSYFPSLECSFQIFKGWFEIKDLAYAPDGSVARLWALFEVHCEGFPQSVFGEVRIAEPARDGPLLTIPAQVRWPGVPAGATTTDVPVTVFATRATGRLGRAALAGSGFAVARDECAGRALAAGGSCQVWLHAAPPRPGPVAAAVEVAGGPEVALEAYGHGGETGAQIDGAALRPADARFQALGVPSRLRIDARRPDGATVSAGFDLPEDQRFVAGGHYVAGQNGASMSVSPCSGGADGSFDVTALAFDTENFLTQVGVRFEERCRSDGSAHTGTISYRAGDTTPPAPWLRTGPVAPQPDLTAAACVGARHLVRGGRRADRLRGTSGRDHVVAGAGRDRVRALGGDDCVDGGAGRDVLDCGRGDDVAIVTKGDRTKGCERVVRRR